MPHFSPPQKGSCMKGTHWGIGWATLLTHTGSQWEANCLLKELPSLVYNSCFHTLQLVKEKWTEKPRLVCISQCSTSTFTDFCGCGCTVPDMPVKGSDQADRLVGNITITSSGFHFGRTKVMRSLRHYLLA